MLKLLREPGFVPGLVLLVLISVVSFSDRKAEAQDKEKLPVIGECVKPCEWALHQGFMLFKASLKKDGHCICVGVLPEGPSDEERK